MSGGRVRTLILAAIGVLALTGCELKDDGDNLVNGKTLFVECCAACHTLARAGAQGVAGPNLDEAWQRAEQDGFGRSTYRGVVHRQIQIPNRFPQIDPQTIKPLPQPMPANLVTGEDAEDVAAYVAEVAARGGEDTGRLAEAGAAKQEELAKAENGTLDIPADPSGRTLYTFKNAEAPAGRSRSTRSTSPPSTTTSRSRATGSTTRARSSRTAARRRSPTSTCRTATTRSSAPCPATVRAAWRARSRSSSAAPHVAARARSAASSRSCWRAACQKKNASANTITTMSKATIIAPAVCWSASALIPCRSPLP